MPSRATGPPWALRRPDPEPGGHAIPDSDSLRPAAQPEVLAKVPTGALVIYTDGGCDVNRKSRVTRTLRSKNRLGVLRFRDVTRRRGY